MIDMTRLSFKITMSDTSPGFLFTPFLSFSSSQEFQEYNVLRSRSYRVENNKQRREKSTYIA